MRKTVAIVGRPNVGKSALFNRLAGKNISIVHDRPGVTRDRIAAECRRGPEVFDIMDTGGIGENTSDVLTEQVQVEANLALEVADLLLFVVDVVTGITPVDESLARILRKTAKPVVLVVNKADSAKRRTGSMEFTKLGFSDLFETSAEHGLGITELVARISDRLGLQAKPAAAKSRKRKGDAEDEEVDDAELPETRSDFPLKLAILGRPNAGKSSLVNALLGKERAIVSPMAGTTRDSLDVKCELFGKPYWLIDTAGIRRRAKVDDEVEAFSIHQAITSMERADICLLIIDCAAGATMQDRKIAQLILQKRKPCILVMNKFDLYHPGIREKDRRASLVEDMRREFFFLSYAPMITISAKKGENLDKLFKTVEAVRRGSQQRIGTGALNRLLADAISNNAGPIGTGPHTFKLLYATQTNQREFKAVPVPHFVLFCNRAFKLHESYLRFLESQIRKEFPGSGLPFTLKVKGKEPLKKDK
jgi:GTP-binding protein